MSNVFSQRPGGRLPGVPSIGSLPLIIILAVVAVALFLVWTFRTIDQGEVGVKLRWGQAVDVLHPGINIVIPGMERVVLLPTRAQKFTPPVLNSYSKDGQAADVKVTVNYAVDPGKAIDVYSRYGSAFVDTVVGPNVNKRFKEVFGRYNARDIVNKRKELGEEVENAIQASTPKSIIIEAVLIENIDFSDSYEAAIESAAQAEAAVRKANQELEQKKVDAEKVVVQANADAQARIAAAKAEADAIRLKGEAEASAIKAKADALRENPNLINLTATEKWDGKLPTTMVPGSAVPFVQVTRQ
jgi:regulator of protease activity HflC (stomatin/prohibitin superfamily)